MILWFRQCANRFRGIAKRRVHPDGGCRRKRYGSHKLVFALVFHIRSQCTFFFELNFKFLLISFRHWYQTYSKKQRKKRNIKRPCGRQASSLLPVPQVRYKLRKFSLDVCKTMSKIGIRNIFIFNFIFHGFVDFVSPTFVFNMGCRSCRRSNCGQQHERVFLLILSARVADCFLWGRCADRPVGTIL